MPVVDMDFQWADGPGGRMLGSRQLGALAPHAFTTRALSFRGGSAADDHQRLAAIFGLETRQVVRVTQVHGRSVLVVQPGDLLAGQPDADALVSTDPARAVAVGVADCVPILLADRRRRVVAAVHAGWRGTCAGVAMATVQAMQDIGAAPADLVVAIGPSIGPCCYQVDDRVRTAFLGRTPASAEAPARLADGPAARRRPDPARWFVEDGHGHWRLDLWQANADQLEDAGVPAAAIHIARLCTADHLDTCFSYRREGAGTGRLVAAIRLTA